MGREFNDGKMDGLFAGTPPLEALRYLIHRAATVKQGKRSKSLMVNDIPSENIIKIRESGRRISIIIIFSLK